MSLGQQLRFAGTWKNYPPSYTPRSYLVSTPSGQVRRNQSDLRPRISHYTYDGDNNSHVNTHSPIQTRSCSGVDIRPPDRLSY